MRIYIHDESTASAVTIAPTATVATLLRAATVGRAAGRWVLVHDNASARQLRPAMAVGDVLDDGDDVRAVLLGAASPAAVKRRAAAAAKSQPTPPTPPRAAAATRVRGIGNPKAAAAAPKSAKPKRSAKKKKPTLTPEQRMVEQQLAQQLGCAASEVQKGLLAHGVAFVRGVGGAQTDLKKARAIFEQILALYPTDVAAAGSLADIHLENDRWDAATRVLRAAMRACASSASSAALCARLGEAHFGAARFDDAAQQYTRALQTSPARTILKRIRKSGGGGGKVQQREHAAAIDEIDTLTIRLAMAHFEAGRHDEAIQLIESVVHRREDHMGGLLAYARAAHERGKRKDAMGILLRAVVLDQNHKPARRRVGIRLREHGGLAALMENFGAPTLSLAPAFAFLATMAKDEGAIDAALHLFSAAARVASAAGFTDKDWSAATWGGRSAARGGGDGTTGASWQHKWSPGDLSGAPPLYILNLMHTLELCMRYADAVALAAAFYRDNPALSVEIGASGASSSSALRNSDVLNVIADLVATSGDVALDAYAGWSHSWDTTCALPRARIARGGSSTASASADVEAAPAAAAADVAAAAAVAGAAAEHHPVGSSGGRVDPALQATIAKELRLDLLAVHFTLVKVLYVGIFAWRGCAQTSHQVALRRILPIMELVEGVRTRHDLHMTTIRNEQAYYCCIAQLLCSLPPPPPLPLRASAEAEEEAATDADADAAAALSTLWVLGDSHALAPAWRTLRSQSGSGASVLLRPVLSTGTKIWHLRKESNFYPKVRMNALSLFTHTPHPPD